MCSSLHTLNAYGSSSEWSAALPLPLLLLLPPEAAAAPLLPDDEVDCLVAALGVDRLGRAEDDEGGGEDVSKAPPPPPLPPLSLSLLLSSAAVPAPLNFTPLTRLD